MTKKAYYKKQKQGFDPKNITYILLPLLVIWLATAMITNKTPLAVFGKSLALEGPGLVENSNRSKDLVLTEEKDSIIRHLEVELEKCQGGRKYIKARVQIEGEYLNMRDKASLTGNVVMRIPAQATVNILFYDARTYYIDNEAGKWCRVAFAGEEGWVWSNYLEEIEN